MITYIILYIVCVIINFIILYTINPYKDNTALFILTSILSLSSFIFTPGLIVGILVDGELTQNWEDHIIDKTRKSEKFQQNLITQINKNGIIDPYNIYIRKFPYYNKIQIPNFYIENILINDKYKEIYTKNDDGNIIVKDVVLNRIRKIEKLEKLQCLKN
jgi:hypothetical protein